MGKARTSIIFVCLSVISSLFLLWGCGGGGSSNGTGPDTQFTWSSVSVLLDTLPAGAVNSPVAAMDLDGNALVAYHHRSSPAGTHSVYASFYDETALSWGPVEAIHSTAVDRTFVDTGSLAAAFDGSGNAMAMWVQGGDSYPFANRRPAGSGWQGAVQTDTVDCEGPRFGFDDTGDAVAVWRHWSAEYIRTSVYDASLDTWSTSSVVSSQMTWDPEIAVNGNGDGVAIWTQYNNGGWDELHARAFTTGGWGTTTRMDENDDYYPFGARVAVDPAGNGMVVWIDGDPVTDMDAVYYNRFEPLSGWSGPAIIATADWADSPQVAFDGSGNAIAVWSQPLPGDDLRFIHASRFDASSETWGPPGLVESPPTDTRSDLPQLAVNSSGRALAVWSVQFQADPSTWLDEYAIHASSYTPSGGWEAPVTVGPRTESLDPVDLRLAIGPDGRGTVVWLINNVTSPKVYVSRYE